MNHPPQDTASTLALLRLLPGLPPNSEICLLAGRGPRGWGSDPLQPTTNSAQGLQILALEPERRFRGGLHRLQEALEWLDPSPSNHAWERVLIGSLSYELASEFNGITTRALPRSANAVDLAGFRAVYLFDPSLRCGRIEGGCAAARERLAQRIHEAHRETRCLEPISLAGPAVSLGRDAFCRGVDAIRDWIRRGDVYQVNLTRALEFSGVSRNSLRPMFSGLSRSGDAPFAALLESPDRVVLSNSPERFLRVENGKVETCPIKGTAPRGGTTQEDRSRAAALRSSGKDAAEHLMIVDLERNDLGRVCTTGSVRVVELAALRSYAAVHHLVSSVQGKLRPDVDALGLLEATFPTGSVTGAPKLRAMEIISELEPVPRDVYTGAIGYFDARGGLDLAVAIRTAIHRAGVLSLHAGGGIVAESDPSEEWLETESKLEAFSRCWGFGA